MLMHEWIRYRKQQVEQTSGKTEESEAAEAEEAADAPVEEAETAVAEPETAAAEAAEAAEVGETTDEPVETVEEPEAAAPPEESTTVEEPEIEAAAEPEAAGVELVEEVEEEPEEAQAAPADAESTLRDREAVLNSLQEELDRAGNSMKERLSQLQARQRQLPIDVGEAEDDEDGGRSQRATETRQELVQRLLDPTLTLREASLLIDVCPTTVRRYTNRGLLNCFRTPGNQRRFHLSDVLEFLERRERGEV